jgi:hypothetical protein
MKGIAREDALDCVGPGWAKIINRLYDTLPKSTYVSQVKEKYGSLRFYIGSGSNRTFDLITAAEEESETTCEACGEPGKIYTEGWFKCRCPACKKQEAN